MLTRRALFGATGPRAAWAWPRTDVVALVGRLDDRLEVVRGDTFLDLLGDPS